MLGENAMTGSNDHSAAVAVARAPHPEHCVLRPPRKREMKYRGATCCRPPRRVRGRCGSGRSWARPRTGAGTNRSVGVAEGTLPGRTAPHTLEGTSSSARPRERLGVDIHAHYYPQAYLDVMAEGKAYGAEYQMTKDGYMLKSPGFSGGPFPAKFTDLGLRLSDMDAQGFACTRSR